MLRGLRLPPPAAQGKDRFTEPWLKSGFLDEKNTSPLSLLEPPSLLLYLQRTAAICQNIFLATEALGLGGGMHCGLFPGLRLGYAVVPRAVLAAFATARYLIDR